MGIFSIRERATVTVTYRVLKLKQWITVPCTNHYFDAFFYVNILTAELCGLSNKLTRNCPIIHEWVLEQCVAEPGVGGASLSTWDTEVSG